LFSVHLASPRDGLQEAARAAWRSASQVQADTELRWAQSENVARRAAAVSTPLLVVGDFNTPSESVLFRRIWDPYTDAFSAAGWGWGYTYWGHMARVRVDHILTGAGWRCERCWVGPDVGCSHRPVLADLIWPVDAGPLPLATAGPQLLLGQAKNAAPVRAVPENSLRAFQPRDAGSDGLRLARKR
jgi:endonuclease/exonuclease/phosphatase (EEP) superfamily protein YafD